MDVTQAKKEFTALKKKLKPKCPLPMNKQKGKMRAPAYLTCMVNMLIESVVKGQECDYDPRALATVMRDGNPLRTFARRMDGAFPSVLNPVAVWEIKEYYYTTTFGSRVADGVYETLLTEWKLRACDRRKYRRSTLSDYRCALYMVELRKSYLCRIVDMLHMGYVDEVLIGREILTRLPFLVKEWIDILLIGIRAPLTQLSQIKTPKSYQILTG